MNKLKTYLSGAGQLIKNPEAFSPELVKRYLQIIRSYFIAFSWREQALLLGFLAIILGVWLISIKNSWQENSRAMELANSQLDLQEQIMAASPDIQNQLNSLLTQFDHTKTFDISKLTARIDRIARQANVSIDILRPFSRSGEVFNTHQLTVQMKQKKIGDVIRFNELLQQESPYIRLEELKISPLKSNPNLLNATFTINSFELDPDTLQI